MHGQLRLGFGGGHRHLFEEAVERRHFAALKDGDDSVDHHRELLKLDPTFIDANLTAGLYEYVVGSLPLPIKVVAGVTGFRGSKKKGLQLIESVSRQGTWARDDAKTLLIVLYTREKRFADALANSDSGTHNEGQRTPIHPHPTLATYTPVAPD